MLAARDWLGELGDNGETRPRDRHYLRQYSISFDTIPAGTLYLFQPARGNNRMLMHQQLHNTGWNGFWNFHDGDLQLSGYFQSLADHEYNFQARLDPELGEATYRGSLFNTDGNDDEFEREILLHHESTYTMDDDSGSLWQRVWQAPPRPLQTIYLDRGERMRPLTRVRDARGRRIYPPGPLQDAYDRPGGPARSLRDFYDRPGGTAESVPPSTGNSDES